MDEYRLKHHQAFLERKRGQERAKEEEEQAKREALLEDKRKALKLEEEAKQRFAEQRDEETARQLEEASLVEARRLEAEFQAELDPVRAPDTHFQERLIEPSLSLPVSPPPPTRTINISASSNGSKRRTVQTSIHSSTDGSNEESDEAIARRLQEQFYQEEEVGGTEFSGVGGGINTSNINAGGLNTGDIYTGGTYGTNDRTSSVSANFRSLSPVDVGPSVNSPFEHKGQRNILFPETPSPPSRTSPTGPIHAHSSRSGVPLHSPFATSPLAQRGSNSPSVLREVQSIPSSSATGSRSPVYSTDSRSPLVISGRQSPASGIQSASMVASSHPSTTTAATMQYHPATGAGGVGDVQGRRRVYGEGGGIVPSNSSYSFSRSPERKWRSAATASIGTGTPASGAATDGPLRLTEDPGRRVVRTHVHDYPHGYLEQQQLPTLQQQLLPQQQVHSTDHSQTLRRETESVSPRRRQQPWSGNTAVQMIIPSHITRATPPLSASPHPGSPSHASPFPGSPSRASPHSASPSRALPFPGSPSRASPHSASPSRASSLSGSPRTPYRSSPVADWLPTEFRMRGGDEPRISGPYRSEPSRGGLCQAVESVSLGNASQPIVVDEEDDDDQGIQFAIQRSLIEM